MQAEQKAFVTAGFASGAAVVLVLLAFVLGWETLSLRTRLAAAHQTGRESAAELSRLQVQQATAETHLAEHREQIEALRAELKNWRDNAATNPPAAGPGTRARVYSGGRYVGMGWIQPGQAQSGEGAAVILDAAPQAAPAAAPAAGQAAAASSYSFVQQYPSWPYLWTVGWIACEPTNNQPTPPAGGVTPEKPVPPSPPAQPVPAPVVASVARTAMPARFNSFPPFGRHTVPRTMTPFLGQRPPSFGQVASGPAMTRSAGATPSVGTAARVATPRTANMGLRR
jgi:hypothetical protein